METSSKTDFAHLFLLLPKNSELPKMGGGRGGFGPYASPGPYAYACKRPLDTFSDLYFRCLRYAT